jgi:hypothetical protein
MGMAGSIVQSVGTNVSATGTYLEGKSQEKAAYAEAGQLERNAAQLRAAGQLEGEEELRKSRLVQSRILAVAGASGASVLDPTVVNIVGRNAAEGGLAAASKRYNAETVAQDKEYQAKIRRMEGRAHGRAATWGASGTALSGFGSSMASGGGGMGMGG